MYVKTEYNNQYNKNHYDRINMFVPIGFKKIIKEKADLLGISMNEYIVTLINNDINGLSKTDIKKQKQALDDDGIKLLEKWQIAKRYYDMIENVSYTVGSYDIQLKAGYINDLTGSRWIHANNSTEIRLIIPKSHKVARKLIDNNGINADWLSDETLERLKHWQIPKKYYSAIHSVTCTDGVYTINLLDGYINDSTGTNRVEFKNVTELRLIIKNTYKKTIENNSI